MGVLQIAHAALAIVHATQVRDEARSLGKDGGNPGCATHLPHYIRIPLGDSTRVGVVLLPMSDDGP